MIRVRKSSDRGFADHGWLKSHHTFSFADYYDPNFIGYSVLRVINEDRIAGGTGFATHGHRDMEIISYVIDGALEHKDSIGTETIILPGEIQRMSAGSGVRHSEYNKLKDRTTHFLQIWIEPDQLGLKPGYEQKSFSNQFGISDLILVCSKSGRNGSVSISQDIDLYACKSIERGENHFKTDAHRHLWIQVINGELDVEGHKLVAGDGAAIEGIEVLRLTWSQGTEFLLFDTP
jgi:redox-sensitive bicupin YhaK (pirin superfamily)